MQHLGEVWRILWPVLILPVVLGAVRLFRERDRRMLRTVGILLAADLIFVWAVNPMAAGTSQTAILTLVAFTVLAFRGLYALEGRIAVPWLLGAAVLAVGILSPDPLTNQDEDIGDYFSQAPLDSGFFIAGNDLLYGGWTMKYVRDLRPDLVLLSTGNFAGWFEEMAVRFNPDLDLSRSVADVGGTALGRTELAVRLIQATVEDNPHRSFFGDW
jgi:hypothetical protein